MHEEVYPVSQAAGRFPANLAHHLRAFGEAGFSQVDCFWQDMQQALSGSM